MERTMFLKTVCRYGKYQLAIFLFPICLKNGTVKVFTSVFTFENIVSVVQQQFRRLIHQIDIQLLMKVPTLFLQNGSLKVLIWYS
jgi:hypothetical protein